MKRGKIEGQIGTFLFPSRMRGMDDKHSAVELQFLEGGLSSVTKVL